ncbi:CheY-like superfamily [Aspergillus granulosus]|uniref:CheY-like superfamily n=1 Tax=Aspergillus granulosus TaxID=176169 RepID=A0ABR4GSI2_9EURO
MHILIAEDNCVYQKVLEKIIARVDPGSTCTIVDDGKQALDYLASPPAACPRPDLILMDIAMPVLDGYDATAVIRTQLPFITDTKIATTPVVAMHTGSIVHQHMALRQRGFDDALEKPIRPNTVKQLLEFWVRRRIVLSPVPGPGRGLGLGGMRRDIVTMPPLVQVRGYKGPKSAL